MDGFKEKADGGMFASDIGLRNSFAAFLGVFPLIIL